MAFAPENKPVHGCFTVPETGAYFEYANVWHNKWAAHAGLLQSIYVKDGSTRGAKILKTVAYVAVDENENGLPVVEKWRINGHRYYQARD